MRRSLTKKLFALAGAIDVRRIKKVDTRLECGIDYRRCSRRIRSPTEVVAPDANNRHLERPEPPTFHECLSFPMILLRVDDKFPQIAVRISEIHAGCRPPRAGDVARRMSHSSSSSRMLVRHPSLFGYTVSAAARMRCMLRKLPR